MKTVNKRNIKINFIYLKYLIWKGGNMGLIEIKFWIVNMQICLILEITFCPIAEGTQMSTYCKQTLYIVKD